MKCTVSIAVLAIWVGTSISCGGEATTASSPSVTAGIAQPADGEGAPDSTAAANDSTGGEARPSDEDSSTSPQATCDPVINPLPAKDFFTDVSQDANIQVGSWDPNPVVSIPINDHSRLGFVDLDGDGYDDIVTHSLYPNPQAGIPFDHAIYKNRGDGTFTLFSEASGLKDVQAGFFAFGDVDNDGDQDCFAGHDIQLGSNLLLLNDGQGHFSPKLDSGLESSLPIAGNAVFADFDNDSHLDLFIGNGHTNFAAADHLYWGLGDGNFQPDAQALKGSPAHPSNGSVACDYDDDGDLDIFVSTYGVSHQKGRNILWENRGGREFENVAAARGFDALPGGNPWLGLHGEVEPGGDLAGYVGANGFGIDCADLNGDGHLDIFLTTISHPVESDPNRKWSDATQILINQGPAAGYTFIDESQLRALPFNEGDVDGAAIDFDNDGRIDLSISRDKKYESNFQGVDQKAWFGLMHQQPDGTYKSVGVNSGINTPDALQQASLADCDSARPCANPQEACLRDRCRIPCTSDLDCPQPYEMCHTGGFCKLKLTMKNAQNHAWSDYDRDGDLDVLIGGRDTGGGRPNFLFRNEVGQDNRWLAITLRGDGDTIQRDAFGARLEVQSAERLIVREVKSSRGMHNSLDTRTQLIGLGDLDCSYTVTVRWPNGERRTLEPQAILENHHMVLTYPATLEQDSR